MPSLRELRRKVKSVKSTQQITKAMKMVSAARLRRAQGRILGARPFANKMTDLLADVLWQEADANGDGVLTPEELQHPLLWGTPGGPRGLLLITADRGLCGGFNTTLIKKGLEFYRENAGRAVELMTVGRKARDYFRRVGSPIRHEYVGIFNQLSYSQAELIGRDVIDFFVKNRASDVTLVYTEFKSAIQQRVVTTTLLPLTPPERPPEVRRAAPFIYEPVRAEILEALFPRYLKAQIFRALLESYSSEMGARMTAMENASKNAQELIAGLTLTANKIRQAAITKEIAELVGGAEVLQ
ncbi:MAG: ATP synthase F1 subunit gamma [Elusimicrobia bacterium]|nr:ATP synthase F1 subunit gamma [Elusimicrobiota bacterium]